MINKNDLRIANRLNKELLKVERKLYRAKDQERPELEQQRDKLVKDLENAELWLDELSERIENGMISCIFAEVFINGMKQRDAAALWGITEQYVSRLIRKGIQEINEKALQE